MAATRGRDPSERPDRTRPPTGSDVWWHPWLPRPHIWELDRMEAKMRRILAREIGSHVGGRIRLQGWLHHQRQLAHVAFLLLRDRSGIAQIVVVDPDVRQRLAGVMAESVIEVVGQVVTNEQAPAGVEVVDPRSSLSPLQRGRHPSNCGDPG